MFQIVDVHAQVQMMHLAHISQAVCWGAGEI